MVKGLPMRTRRDARIFAQFQSPMSQCPNVLGQEYILLIRVALRQTFFRFWFCKSYPGKLRSLILQQRHLRRMSCRVWLHWMCSDTHGATKGLELQNECQTHILQFFVLFVTISMHLDAFRFVFHAILWSKVWKWGHRWWRTDTSIKQYCPKRSQLSVEAVKQDIRSLSSAFCFLFSPEGTILPVLTTTLCRISGYPEGHLTIQLLQGDLIHCFAFSGFSWPHAGPQIKDWCKHFCSNWVMLTWCKQFERCSSVCHSCLKVLTANAISAKPMTGNWKWRCRKTCLSSPLSRVLFSHVILGLTAAGCARLEGLEQTRHLLGTDVGDPTYEKLEKLHASVILQHYRILLGFVR